jgi:subtilisin family serine protease
MKRIPLVTFLSLLCAIIFSFLSHNRATAISPSASRLSKPENQVERPLQVRDGQVIDTRGRHALDETEFVPGEVLVKFKESALADELARERKTSRGTIALAASPALTRLLEGFGVEKARKPFARGGAAALAHVIKLTSPSLAANAAKTKELVNALRQRPEVEYAELNTVMRAQYVPNDPYYASSGAWGQSFRDLWGLQNISAETAWDTSQGDNVVVAVVDTGLDYDHEDIAANVWQNPGETGLDTNGNDRRFNGLDDDGDGRIDDWHGWDFVTTNGPSGDNDPMDDHGHGTHVAGTIAAVGDNGLGIIGVAPKAKIMALKGLNANGSGSVEDLSNAIVYAADHGASMINCSWGGISAPQVLIDAVNYAHDTKGVVIVAAAGNSNADVGTEPNGFSPACLHNVITVSAFDHADAKAYFSNFGNKIDVAAPGGGDTDPTGLVFAPAASILSLLSSGSPNVNQSLVVGAKYWRLDGTSMASPHVAGVAALVRSLHPEFSPEQVRQAIRHGSDDVGPIGFDQQSGSGRLNAASALHETAPLAVQLNGPTGMLTGLAQVNVTGTAAGASLASWRLEYGAGTTPDSWTLIAASSQPVNGGTLATWDLTNATEGMNTLHLVAQNQAGQFYEDRLLVEIENIILKSPSPDSTSIFRGGQTINVTGTVAVGNFSHYTITVRDFYGASLIDPAITLTNGGTQQVRDGLLGTWDTTGVAAGYYVLTLNVYLNDGSLQQREATVIIDPALHAGWPQNLDTLNGSVSSLAVMDHLDAYDINGDGSKEIINAYNQTVHVLDQTGAELPGWPQSIAQQNLRGAYVQRSPAIADLNGDGSPEIVTANGVGQLFIFSANGQLWNGWPKSFGQRAGTASVADLYGNGAKQIILPTDAGLYAIDANGNTLPGWPVNISDGTTPPVIGDVDGDGQKEIVVATTAAPTNLYILRADGSIMPGWPQAINPTAQAGDYYWSYPVLGDLDEDGTLECVIGSADGYVYAFHYDGTSAAGWPQQTKAAAVNTPAIGDIDGDGKLEVIAGNMTVNENGINSNYLFAWHADGTLLPNWPVKNEHRLPFTYFGYGAPALVDLDQDGKSDVVTSNDDQHSALIAYRFDGTKVAGFPKSTAGLGAFSANTAVVADLDNDGLLEMAWIDVDKNIYVWDTQTSASVAQPWPMFQHDERHTGALPTTHPRDLTPPSVSITSPSSGALLAGTVTVSAQASDNVAVVKVELYRGATLIGTSTTSPYNFSWDTKMVADGPYTLTSKARDAAGNVGTSAGVNVTVDNTPPAVSLTAPASGAVVSGTAVTITASASDNVGLRRVDFYRDTNVQIGSSTTAPFSMSWNSTTVPSGAHTLFAIATDMAGNTTTSTVRSITVDNTQPTVSITKPTDNSTVTKKTVVTIAANAADNVGVTKVEFYVNGALTCTDTTAPYTCNWTVPNVRATFTLQAKAYDGQGNNASSTIHVTSK